LTQNILSVSEFDSRIGSKKEKLSVSVVSVHIRSVFTPKNEAYPVLLLGEEELGEWANLSIGLAPLYREKGRAY
jgi:hypothetical protein